MRPKRRKHVVGLPHDSVLLYPITVLLFEYTYMVTWLTALKVNNFEVVHKYLFTYFVLILCSLSRINTYELHTQLPSHVTYFLSRTRAQKDEWSETH